jgi:hypothetical protein
MKRIVWVFMIIIFLFSCKKNISETEELKGVSKSTNGKYEQPCRIDYMVTGGDDTAFFSYTPWGDPDKIDIPSRSVPSYWFTYDKNKRLVELQGAWEKDVNTNEIRRFYYQGNKVVTDSTTFYPGYRIGKFVYDKYDRIIEYNYIVNLVDDEGNIREGETTIDTVHYNYPDENPYVGNRNYLAGNRVLMFLNRYYHKTTPAESYNSFGYPTHFAEFQWPSLFCCFSIFEIVYDCSGSKKTQPPTQ